MKPTHKYWELVGIVLERIVTNMELAQDSSQVSSLLGHFNSVRAPAISIRAYLAQIHNHANCSESCYILAFIYLDRLLQKNPGVILNSRNIHRLLLSAVVLAIKYSDDIYADNFIYARAGGVPLKEMNVLEFDMLKLLHYSLFIHADLYFQYLNELQLQAFRMSEEQSDAMQCEVQKSIHPVESMKTICSASEMCFE
eukprot:TRINITY_DN5295_c0_g13_i1.p1 TRINITY_DN5295_c0_g13~~TRINITY_DN5295_c0_g13_i1.p1  ORF type:complete len:197 (+),score=32.14 TRINITY_DN5295_c0_g13_i1:369-959(+)